MKDLRDGDSNTTLRSLPGSHIGPEKMMSDQDRRELHHLVSSSVPSPPFSGLSLLNPTTLSVFGADPRAAMLSAHLFATYAASNPMDARFQIPMPIPYVPVSTSASQLFHSAGTGQVTGLPPSSLPSAQLDILSSWVKEHSSKEDRKLTRNKTGSKKKVENWSVSKANKRNKTPAQRTNGLISSSDNHIDIKKEKLEDNGSDMGLKSTIIPTDKPSKGCLIKNEKNGDSMQTSNINNNNNNNHNNNMNNKGSTQQQQQQQSNQSRDKVFTCPICSRCFGYKHVLQNHERTHTGEKPFECTICQKKFTRDHHLKTHMRLHTGEKPYQCSHCDRQFVQVANLRRHLRVHTGERPYSCELCSSRFSDSNQLKAHMLIHKGEKPYSCTDCGLRFRRRHHLAHHKCNSKDKSPVDSLQDMSPPSVNNNKRERKSRETRRIIRLETLPVSTVTTGSPMAFLPVVVPEQTHPEDLSLGGNHDHGLHHFNGSHSSCSASPSPPSGGSHGSLGLYCHSITSSSDPPGYSSDEERSVTASSSNNGKTESDDASPLQI